MSKGSKVLIAVLAAVFVAFLAWYGGRGKPLTPAETDALLAQIAARAKNDGTADGRLLDEIRRLVANDDGNEFFMVNLIRFRQKALYPDGFASGAHGAPYSDDALEADARYNHAIAPYLLRHGALPVFIGKPQGRFIDEAGDTEWDRVAIVRYRSRRDLLEMVVALAGHSIAVHKWAAIEKTQVFPVQSPFSLVFVRGLVAVLLAILGHLLHALLRNRAWYRGAPA